VVGLLEEDCCRTSVEPEGVEIVISKSATSVETGEVATGSRRWPSPERVKAGGSAMFLSIKFSTPGILLSTGMSFPK
jgi:hypothetical protein